MLGAMMFDPSVIDAVTSKLTRADFYRPKHGFIFDAIVKNHDAGEPAGPDGVTSRLADSGDLDRVGGAPYLSELYRDAAPPGQVMYFVGKVIDAADRRRLDEVAIRLHRAAGKADLHAEVAEIGEVLPSRTGSAPWVDLAPYLDGRVERPVPSIGLPRSDGVRLIYPGKEHAVVGEMEAGKGWFCVASAAVELEAGNPVIYLAYEEADPSDTVERLQALHVHDDVILDRFRFVAPEKPVTSADLRRLLTPAPTLVVHDGVNEAMSLHGWGIREEDGAAKFRRNLVLPCLRVGAATLSADHVVKDVEKRGRNALGSIHKGNGLSGSLIMLENVQPFGRGQRGVSRVYVTKDRPGHLRRHGVATRIAGKTCMGDLVVDDTQRAAPMLELEFVTPPARPVLVVNAEPADPVADLDEHVFAVVQQLCLSGTGEVISTTIRAHAGRSSEKVGDALIRLVHAGRLTVRPGPGRSRLYSLPPSPLIAVPA